MPRTRESVTSSPDRLEQDSALIDRMMTPVVSRDLVGLLRRRGWSLARLAKGSGAPQAVLKQIEAGQARFSARHVFALARATRTDALRLAFDAMEPSAMRSPNR